MTRLFMRLQNDVIRHLCRQNAWHSKGCVYSGINRSFHLASSINGKVVPFKLSDIGEGIKEVEVKEWFVNVSDYVVQFDDICEVQSDKASVVITSRFDGTIRKLFYKVGDIAQVGDALVSIEVEGEEEAESPSAEVKEEPAAATQIPAPTTKIHAATPPPPIIPPPVVAASSKVLATPAVRYLAKLNNINIEMVAGSGESGRIMKEDVQSVIDMLTAKPVEPPARATPPPVLSAPPAATFSKPPAAVIPPPATIATPPPAVIPPPATIATPPPAAIPTPPPATFSTPPAAAFATPPAAVIPPPATIATPPPPPPQPALFDGDRSERVSGIRKAMWKAMDTSLQIPHFGYDDEYDLTKLVEVREQLKPKSKRLIGSKISYMPFILKACSLALSEYPILNSYIDVKDQSIIYKADHNIGVAIDTAHGLLLPSVKRIQQLSIYDIAMELNRLQHAGFNNKLAPQDLAGGTFSLSNIGSIGGTYARPVIFSPQVAIGALGKIQKLPRFGRKGEIKESRIMCTSWSADHRVIEGATMARFSNALKEYLENPETMLFHLK